jgi:hypothetical protein
VVIGSTSTDRRPAVIGRRHRVVTTHLLSWRYHYQSMISCCHTTFRGRWIVVLSHWPCTALPLPAWPLRLPLMDAGC